MTTIRQLHADFASRTMPKDAPSIQRVEVERAFYTGSLAFITLMLGEIALLSDDEAEKRLEALHTELSDYFRLLRTIPGPEGTTRQ